MFAKQVAVSSLLCGVLSVFAIPAHADDIKLSAAACANYNAREALDIDRLAFGVQNANLSPRQVICAFPRSPITADEDLEFVVDGNNIGGTTTSCTVTVYDAKNEVVASKNFERSVVTWRATVTFPKIPVIYATLLCTLPGFGLGQIYGLIARG